MKAMFLFAILALSAPAAAADDSLLADALGYQLAYQFNRAILTYEKLIAAGEHVELASRLMQRCYAEYLADAEYHSVTLKLSQPAVLALKDLLPEPYEIKTDVNWRHLQLMRRT